MKSNHNRQSVRWLVAAALATGAATAHAATGYAVTAKQEASVTTGMTTDQVIASVGRPARIVRYRTESGPTWAYAVVGALDASGGEARIFEVDFGADGAVAKSAERTVMESGE